jgi:manganese/zinc/iron transport system permease protein
MSIAQIEIIMIAIVVGSACVLPGVFLVLRGMSLMSDAISHASLLGIVVFFFFVRTLDSPWLVLGASFAGILTVVLTELLIQTKRLKKDAAIGLVFPLFFSIGVILITKFIGGVHLDSDCVLFGEIAFAPFERAMAFGIDFGPSALWLMSGILLLNATFIIVFYKELKLVTFDEGLAKALGFSPIFIHYALMMITSITAVGAFESVGSILVVALMITPPSTAYLLTTKLNRMIWLSLAIGVLSGVGGYFMAFVFDVSISGSMATVSGLIFLVALFFSPRTGVLYKLILTKQQRVQFSAKMLLVQLLDHEGKDNEAQENTIRNMVDHMGWSLLFAKRVTGWAVRNDFILRQGDFLKLTSLGRETARQVMVTGQ